MNDLTLSMTNLASQLGGSKPYYELVCLIMMSNYPVCGLRHRVTVTILYTVILTIAFIRYD